MYRCGGYPILQGNVTELQIICLSTYKNKTVLFTIKEKKKKGS